MGRGVFGVEAMSREDFLGGEEQGICWKTLTLWEAWVEGFSEGDNFVNQLNI